ncbi:MAG TPA: universal stress protein [Burkholderiaceae bacterium]
MFKHILIPTDGSKRSLAAIHAGMEMAKERGARVTGIYVIPEFHVISYQAEMLDDSRAQFVAENEERAKKYLCEIEEVAKEKNVAYDAVSVTSDHPYEEIIKAAKAKECDLIVMASHGRKGLRGILLGSETHKVLSHSDIPVLVYR